MNAAQKMRLEITKKCIIVEKEDIILKKGIKDKEITREKKTLKIGSPQYEREF